MQKIFIHHYFEDSEITPNQLAIDIKEDGSITIWDLENEIQITKDETVIEWQPNVKQLKIKNEFNNNNVLQDQDVFVDFQIIE